MFTAALFVIAKIRKQPKTISTDEERNCGRLLFSHKKGVNSANCDSMHGLCGLHAEGDQSDKRTRCMASPYVDGESRTHKNRESGGDHKRLWSEGIDDMLDKDASLELADK